MKRTTLVVLLIICLVFLTNLINPKILKAKTIRAVSMNVLQEQLKANEKQGTYPEKLVKLAGLKKIMGYLIDEENNDLIIFGSTDQELPALLLEDFVIALRNAWRKYAPLQGNTYIYSFPGCTIDPDPNVMQKLQQFSEKIVRSTSIEQVKNILKEWHSTCKKPQNVGVMGIPFNTRFGDIMVKADYNMKILVDGTDSLDIPGFISLTEMKLAQVRSDIIQNKPITISLSGMNRFWFYPGTNLYEEDQGTVLIKQCPVELLTEETFVSKSGQYVRGSMADPGAKKFADGFSLLYDKIANERPIYIELENLFRFFALAQVIKYQSVENIDISYLLEQFPITQISVEQTLPGRSAVQEFQHRQDMEDGYQVYNFWLPSCGGVSIEIQPKPENFVKNTTGYIANLKKKILNLRSSTKQLSWDFSESGSGLLSTIRNGERLQQINSNNKNFTVLTVENKFTPETTGYVVSDGINNKIYDENSMHKLVKAVKEKLGSAKQAYLDMKNFPDHKIEAFASNFRRPDSEFTVKTLSREGEATEFQDAIFSNGIKLEKQPETIENVFEGEFKGFKRVTLDCITKVAKKTVNLTVEIYAKTKELLSEFLNKLISRLLNKEYVPHCVTEILNSARKELIKDNENIKIIIKLKDAIKQIIKRESVMHLEPKKQTVG